MGNRLFCGKCGHFCYNSDGSCNECALKRKKNRDRAQRIENAMVEFLGGTFAVERLNSTTLAEKIDDAERLAILVVDRMDEYRARLEAELEGKGE